MSRTGRSSRSGFVKRMGRFVSYTAVSMVGRLVVRIITLSCLAWISAEIVCCGMVLEESRCIDLVRLIVSGATDSLR